MDDGMDGSMGWNDQWKQGVEWHIDTNESCFNVYIDHGFEAQQSIA